MDRYLNFDLEISRRSTQYQARVIASPNGEARNRFDFPFAQQELDQIINDFSQTRSFILNENGTSSDNSKPSVSDIANKIRQFGETLFNAVFQKSIGETYRESKVTADSKKAGLRIRLRFPENPELINIPWEFLFDDRTYSFLTLSGNTSIVRYMELSIGAKSLQITPPLRVLVVISDPKDYPPLNVAKERDKIQQALTSLEQKQRIKLDIIEHATLHKITQSISEHHCHIIHFIGHGDFNEERNEGVLVTEDDKGNGLQVSSQRIATIIEGSRSTRLIVLNACEGGITSLENIFSGVAQSVVKKGVPAVLAMQYVITDKSAIVFSETFYNALSQGSPVDTSLSLARLAIYNQPNEVEFGTAALYMRAKSGRLFGKDKKKFKPNNHKFSLDNKKEKRSHKITLVIFTVTTLVVLIASGFAVVLYNILTIFI
ncbi:MAG TPA: CHAT domain-containing protein [Leucothrix mucor]|uniref:CHAT domain-containing protein n=1 Tax=Leucothrix mucor TaxID=45248 RepID=A0A7V2T0Q3_LEUMU|nr:CHAT domain-containing protein [Leucothrix mucor]